MKKALSSVLVNAGFGNTVAVGRVVAVVSPAGSPMKRLRDVARESGRLIDVTEGRRTRSIIVMDSGHVVLSALQAETITNRINGIEKPGDDAAEEGEAADA